MNLIPSTIKLEEFNECYPKEIKQQLEKIKYQVVDIPEEVQKYWQNDAATLVIALENVDPDMVFQSARMATPTLADEIDMMMINGKMVVRYWWD